LVGEHEAHFSLATRGCSCVLQEVSIARLVRSLAPTLSTHILYTTDMSWNHFSMVCDHGCLLAIEGLSLECWCFFVALNSAHASFAPFLFLWNGRSRHDGLGPAIAHVGLAPCDLRPRVLRSLGRSFSHRTDCGAFLRCNLHERRVFLPIQLVAMEGKHAVDVQVTLVLSCVVLCCLCCCGLWLRV